MAKYRFTQSNPCPICGGHDAMTRGENKRCFGFLSEDRSWAHCTREEHSGGLAQYDKSKTYAHLLVGNCKCGVRHDPSPDAPTPKLKLSGKKPLVATYDYCDEQGELLYQACRTNPKRFFLRRPNSAGGWEKGVEGVRRVLYRLPELLASDASVPVFVCEGEKDVDALTERGLVATTNPFGAEKWRDEYNEHLRGRNVVILPDNDEPGRNHAEKVSKSLRGVAASVKVVALPKLPESGDVSDWLSGGGTTEQLQEIVSKTPVPEDAKKTISGTGIQSAAELLAKEFPEPKFAVYGLLSEGVTIFAGKPKTGKSWCGLGMAVAVASGGRALDSIPVEQGDVLYLALEDGERRLQTRLQQILRDSLPPAMLDVATQWKRLDEGGLDALEGWLKGHPGARLIVIDTLKRVRPRANAKAQIYDNDYEALAPLGDIAREYGVSIVVIHHTRKQESEDPLDLISGSFGLSGSADGVLVLKRAHGQTDAALYVTGRDFDSQELALRWEASVCGWKIVGEAGDLYLGKERREIIALLKMEGPLTPKQTAARLKRNEGATRKLMLFMAKDGQLINDGSGNYSIPLKDDSGNYGNYGNSDDSDGTEGMMSYPPDTLFGNSVSSLIQ